MTVALWRVSSEACLSKLGATHAKVSHSSKLCRRRDQGAAERGGTSRRAAVEKALSSVGGKLEGFYYAFGDTDAFVIVELPDNATAAALSLIVNAPGTLTAKIAVLLTPEEIDAATQKAPSYRPPGQ